MAKHTDRRRTIGMPSSRARQVALAAAYLGMTSSEDFIQSAISDAIIGIASRDRAFAAMITGAAGADWLSKA